MLVNLFGNYSFLDSVLVFDWAERSCERTLFRVYTRAELSIFFETDCGGFEFF